MRNLGSSSNVTARPSPNLISVSLLGPINNVRLAQRILTNEDNDEEGDRSDLEQSRQHIKVPDILDSAATVCTVQDSGVLW